MGSRRKKGLLAIASLLVLLGIIIQSGIAGNKAWAAEKHGKAVIIVINHLTWDDVIAYDMKNLIAFGTKGSTANLVHKTAVSKSTAQGAATSIGAGTRASAYLGQPAAMLEEWETTYEGPASEVYKRRTGNDGRHIVNITMPSLQYKNKQHKYKIIPGLMGQTFKDAGLKVAAAGNSDMSLTDIAGKRRETALIAMDQEGRLESGDISAELLKKDSLSPFGLSTDYHKLERSVKNLYKRNDFMVIDLGDTSRLNDYRAFLVDEQFKKMKKRTLQRTDKNLGKLLQVFDKEKDMIMVLSPAPPSDNPRQPLTVFAASGGSFKKGFATSSSSHRKGLVVLPDIAPTVFSFFDLPNHATFIGTVMETLKTEGLGMKYLKDMNARAVLIDGIKPFIINGFVIMQILSLLPALALILTKGDYKKLRFAGKAMLLFIMALPLSFFLSPMLIENAYSAGGAVASILGVGIFLVVIGLVLAQYNRFLPIIFYPLALSLLLFYDLATGANFNISTIMGYSPIIAGRLYGLGNESFSLFVVCTLLGVTAFLEWLNPGRKFFLIPVGIFALTVFFIGFPSLGADAGGIIAASAGMGFTAVHLYRKRISLRELAMVALAVVFIMAAFISFDKNRAPSAQTHIGRSMTRIEQGGFSEINMIATRKAATNWRILRRSPWSISLLVVIALLVFLRYRPPGALQGLMVRHPYLLSGVEGSIVAAVMGFLFNDSGIAIPAVMMAYLTPALVYLLLQEKIEGDLPELQAMTPGLEISLSTSKQY